MFAVDGLFEMVQLSNRRLGEFHKKIGSFNLPRQLYKWSKVQTLLN